MPAMRGGPRFRTAIVWLTLAGTLAPALALPVPLGPGVPQAAGVPFPCRGHRCGCASPAACWAGDCCCFTLAEKIAWAEARGVEPPRRDCWPTSSRPPCNNW